MRAAIAAVLFFGTLLLFSRVLGSDFDFVNYDDPDYVTKNLHVQGGLTADGVRWALTSGAASNWHPLTWMSHMLDWSWFGKNPRGHHATSVVIHALNAALVFLALRRLTGALWTSAWCAALFAWHPLRVESVAWIAERKDVLSGCFAFLLLWAYAEYAHRRREGGKGAGKFYAGALVAFALGLMAKPMLVTMPCVLLLLDFWPLRRLSKDHSGLRSGAASRADGAQGAPLQGTIALVFEKIPFFALVVASSVVTYAVQKEGGSVSLALSLDARLANAVVAVARYIGKFIFPFDLAVLYPHPGTWAAGKVAAAVLFVGALTGVAWWQRQRPWMLVGWLWFLGMLVPVIGIVQVGLQSMADRYTYLPMLGLQVALLWTLRDRFESPGGRRGWTTTAAVVLLLLALRTWNQLGVWKSSYTLFDHTLAVTDNNYLAHNNRGIYLGDQGRTEEAAADYRRALEIRPDYPTAANNLGRILMQQGHAAEALPLLRAAVKAEPKQLEAHNNLANALSDTGALDEAMEHYEFILARDPRHVDALVNSGVALAMQNKLPEARARMEKALALNPQSLSAHSNLGNVCAMLGERDEAIRHYRAAIALDRKDSKAHHNLGNVLADAGRLPEAAASYEEAVAAAPNNAESHAHLGLTYAKLARRDDALRELRRAVALAPNYPQAKAWLQQVEQSK